MSISLNKYLHGTLWGWVNGELALIISNDEHNSHSPEVNCISVTGILDEIVSIDNFRCSQIHTVKKTALTDFNGAVPAPILVAVKAKIRVLFNMGENVENLQSIKATAAKLIGELSKIEQTSGSDYTIKTSPPPVMEDAPIIKEAVTVVVSTEDAADDSPESVPINKPAGNKRPKASDKKPRGKKSQKPEISERTGKPKREMRSYSDEDEAFVLDENHSTDEIMERFGYTEKRKVADLKFMLKKRRAKRQEKASQ